MPERFFILFFFFFKARGILVLRPHMSQSWTWPQGYYVRVPGSLHTLFSPFCFTLFYWQMRDFGSEGCVWVCHGCDRLSWWTRKWWIHLNALRNYFSKQHAALHNDTVPSACTTSISSWSVCLRCHGHVRGHHGPINYLLTLKITGL